MKSIHELLEVAIRQRASDLILKAGTPPHLRVDGRLISSDLPALTPDDTCEIAYGIIDSAGRDYLLQYPESSHDALGASLDGAEGRMRELQSRDELDLVLTIPGLARVRANLFLQRGAIGAALRIIPLHPYTIDELRLPPVLKEMALQPQGLIVVTGPTGSGKTTTMAAIIEEINRGRPCNVFTIEEPVEYVFTDRKSVIHQREVRSDTRSFAAALRSVTRQSPDVIAIGEMRDTETMDAAMTASEIGHLVITTLHTVSAAATVDRIVNSFPRHLKHQVSAQLAASLLCVTSQRLIERAAGPGRLPAVEVMTNSPRVRKQIEEGETGELYASIREGQHFGMNTMNQALERLIQSRKVALGPAMQFAGNPAELKQMLRGAG
ncbi:MAG: PilT/PilU family type 4a pilus ATPase [Chthonomonadales bacterium]|nr:PilT/PilU family type 4a pilus ATPase [Chthonomonadales bacterium]